MEPTQPPIQCLPGAPSPGVKRQGHEVDHSPSPSAKVKNGGVHPLLHQTSPWPRDIFAIIFVLFRPHEIF
jgi:hypothetical protein